jgi:hypothetical protein
MDDLSFSIDECPLCRRQHGYRIRVTRSVAVGYSPGSHAAPTSERAFVRLLTCPDKNEHFQATLTLSETALTKIREIEISEG